MLKEGRANFTETVLNGVVAVSTILVERNEPEKFLFHSCVVASIEVN